MSAADFHIAFVLDHILAVFVDDDALAVVGVHRVGGHRNAFRGDAAVFTIRLGGHIFTDHPAAFADIELGRPVAAFGVFIHGEAPLGHEVSDDGRDPLVVRGEV